MWVLFKESVGLKSAVQRILLIPSFCPLHLVSLSSAIAMAVILREFDIDENYGSDPKGTLVDVNSKSELEIKLIGMKDDSSSASQFQSLKLETTEYS